jgi:hypothetical protein
MKKLKTEEIRVLGLAPSSYGCGFAVMEGKNVLVAWGVKTLKGGDKNARSLSNVANLIAQYEPNVIALENTKSPASRRSPRIQALIGEIAALAKEGGVIVKQFSRKQLSIAFLSDERGTKHALAAFLANRFPEELGPSLPAKRRLWESDDCRMDIFDAVALAGHLLQSWE